VYMYMCHGSSSPRTESQVILTERSGAGNKRLRRISYCFRFYLFLISSFYFYLAFYSSCMKFAMTRAYSKASCFKFLARHITQNWPYRNLKEIYLFAIFAHLYRLLHGRSDRLRSLLVALIKYRTGRMHSARRQFTLVMRYSFSLVNVYSVCHLPVLRQNG